MMSPYIEVRGVRTLNPLEKLVLDCFGPEALGLEKQNKGFSIKKVIFNKPKTIVLWSDNTKTIVTCGKDDKFDKEKGLAMAIIKKICGNTGSYNKIFEEHLKD